jgi:steroid delta-isomerase-like uncharacterized protein
VSEQNIAATRRLYDGISSGNAGILEELLDADAVDHDPAPGFPPTKAGAIEFFRATLGAFPDLAMSIRDIAVADDKVWVLLTMSGTQRGEYLGVPASGKTMSVPLVDILRFRNGKITDHWGVLDSGIIVQQLGAIGNT